MKTTNPKETRTYLLFACLIAFIIGLWLYHGVSIVSAALFVIGILVLFIIPGALLIQPFRTRFSWLEYLLLATVIGIAACCMSCLLASYIYHFLSGSRQSIVQAFAYLWAAASVIAFTVALIKGAFKLPEFKSPAGYWWIALVLVPVAIVWINNYHNGYVLSDGRMGVDHVHDFESLLHVELSTELLRTFPPKIPFLFDLDLKNYHFMSDLFLAIISGLTNLAVRDLFYRFVNTMVLVLVTVSAYAALFRFTQNKKASLLWALLLVVGGDLSLHFAPIAMWLNPGGEFFNIFTGQLFISFIANLQTGIWVFFFCMALVLFESAEKTGDLWLYVLGGLLTGTSIHFVSFAGAGACLALGLSALWIMFRRREFGFFWATFTAGIAVLPMLLQSIPSHSDMSLFKFSWGWYAMATAIKLGFTSSPETAISFANEHRILMLVVWPVLLAVSLVGIGGFRWWGARLFYKDAKSLSSKPGVRIILVLNIMLGVALMTFVTLNYKHAWQSPNTAYFFWMNGFIPLVFYGALSSGRIFNRTDRKSQKRMIIILLILALPQPLLFNVYRLSQKLGDFDDLYAVRLNATETKAIIKLKKMGVDDWVFTSESGYAIGLAETRTYAVDLPVERHNFLLPREVFDELLKTPRVIFNEADPVAVAHAIRPFIKDVKYIFADSEHPLKFLEVDWLEPIVANDGVGLYKILPDKLNAFLGM